MPTAMDVNETFRRKLIEAREARGLNAAELSRRAGLNVRAVKDIEERRAQSPKLSTACALAGALGVDVSELIDPAPRHLLARELMDFLSQYDEESQLQLLSALRAIAPRHSE